MSSLVWWLKIPVAWQCTKYKAPSFPLWQLLVFTAITLLWNLTNFNRSDWLEVEERRTRCTREVDLSWNKRTCQAVTLHWQLGSITIHVFLANRSMANPKYRKIKATFVPLTMHLPFLSQKKKKSNDKAFTLTHSRYPNIVTFKVLALWLIVCHHVVKVSQKVSQKIHLLQ